MRFSATGGIFDDGGNPGGGVVSDTNNVAQVDESAVLKNQAFNLSDGTTATMIMFVTDSSSTITGRTD